MMSKKTYFTLSAVIFSLAGTVHLIRLIGKLPLQIGAVEVPFGVSIVGAVIAFLLAVSGLKLRD